MADKVVRDYSSVHSIKDFALNELAPKYFEVDVNQQNTGLFGFTTDLIATTMEDTLNALTMYVREIIPSTAELPETLYNRAASLQIDQLMATPSAMEVVLFINEKDILEKGTHIINNRIQFNLDSNLIIDIEGQQFMLDYDIEIIAKPDRGDHIFTASYDLSFENSMSSVRIPYIVNRRVRFENERFLGLVLTVHRVNRFEKIETLIDNDRINLPTITFEFNDQLANFEVLYKAPGQAEYVQLAKRLFSSYPVKNPFCFYRLRNENEVEISFTLRESYFQPQFNSELLIRYYTTTGEKGNFPLYAGNNFAVIPKSDVHDYNNNLIIFGICQSASIGGTARLSLEDLRAVIVEKTSTSGAYNTENDLQLYFNNNNNIDGTNVLFIKRRDDALERLFSAFSLFRDSNNDIYPTNTLDMEITDADFDSQFDVSGRYLFKPGHLFAYKGSSIDTVIPIPGKTISDDLSTIPEEFIYTNPFLIIITKSPGIVGYYLNSVDSGNVLDYTYVNDSSPVQFIANDLSVTRNAVSGEDFYTMDVSLLPTTVEDLGIVTQQGVATGKLVVRGTISDTDGSDLCMFEFDFVSGTGGLYKFQAKVYTDDYMTADEKFRVKNAMDVLTGDTIDKVVPMVDCVVNIHAFYRFDDSAMGHKYHHLTDLQPFTLTNTYSTEDNTVNFITPVNMMRSQVKYVNVPDPDDPGESTYLMRISFVPFIKAAAMKDAVKYKGFIDKLYSQYAEMQRILDKITTNFGVDMKFYRTYGRSKNFTVGEDAGRLDKVNIGIRFGVSLTVAAIETDIVRDLKTFIKEFVEEINTSGYNAIFISNLMRKIENTFPDTVQYLKFVKINNYDSSVQIVQNRGVNIEVMTKEERRQYVPEYLTIGLDDIRIDVLSI